jgi:uncharacterized protein DUF6655
MRPALRPARVLPFTLALLVCAGPGCGTVKQTSTARTGTEQLLLTNAWDSALQKVDFRPLTGVPVFLDTANVSAVDQGWVVSSLRQALLSQGVLLRAKPEQAQWVVEARVGAYGTDTYDWLLGIPQTVVPPTITGVPAGSIPEIPFIKKSNQQGVVKLALFAYDRSSGQLVWNSGTMLATSNAKDVYIGGVGPIQSGSIRGGTEFVGIKLPIGTEPAPDESKRPPGSSLRTNTSPFSLKRPTADLDGFAP